MQAKRASPEGLIPESIEAKNPPPLVHKLNCIARHAMVLIVLIVIIGIYSMNKGGLESN